MASSTPVTSTPLPRLIHQTWKHAHLRGPLQTCAESFQKWNPDWKYCFWTDEQCLELIRLELPEFLPTYLAYPRGIFRADIFRVVVLYLRGGVYADLDVECQRSLDELLAAAGDDDWEVLLARDHPSHERLHWMGRAMWMNDFMVAKPRCRFFRVVLDRLTSNLRRGLPFNDVVQQTGPGLFSTVVEASLSGVTGLGIRPLPWRWVHPLPNVYVNIPERSAYKRLILGRTWREGAQVPLGDDEEGDPALGGPPFVAHYWWHSYIEDCHVVNMLLKYADSLLQTDGEIAERRLQKWVPRFGEALDAAGQALARLAERGRNSLCLLVGEPVVGVDGDLIPFRTLAAEILAGLPISVRSVTELPERSHCAPANDSEGAPLRGEVSLLAVDLTENAGERLERLAKILGANMLHPGAGVVLLGREAEAAESFVGVLTQAGLVCETGSGGWFWIVPEAAGIPKVIHLFASETGLSRIENDVLAESWRRQHARSEWTVKTWTPETARELVEDVAPDFLDAFLAYPDDLTRWAAARYFVLRREGGVAVKPGALCLRSLGDILEGKTAWLAARSGGEKNDRHEMISDSVVASVAAHPFWAHIEQDLVAYAKAPHSKAAGSEFLTARARECSRFLPRAHWPAISEPGLFDLMAWPEKTDNAGWARRARRQSRAMLWERVPAQLRTRYLRTFGRNRGTTAERLDPLVIAAADAVGWTRFYPILSDEAVAAAEAAATPAEQAILEEFFAVERIVNPKPSGQVISTSLFWKNVDTEDAELPVPTMKLLMEAKKLGLVKRFDPWSHYVQPLLRGAEKLAAERPDVTVRVYLANDLAFLLPRLARHCEVRLMKHSSIRHNPGAMWRFLALGDAEDHVTVVDSDGLEASAHHYLGRTGSLINAGLMSWREPWREPAPLELCSDGRYFKYRPMIACGFGSRVRLDVERLMKAFIWHYRKGAFARTVRMPEGREIHHFQNAWPGYGADEWFLATTLYPRLLPHGLLTFDPYPLNSTVSIADTALNSLTHRHSRRG